MKTETQIAQENIKNWKKDKIDFPIRELSWKFACISHKVTCQRFLEFLEKLLYQDLSKDIDPTGYTASWLEDKATDLKQAIKLYNENGI